MALRVNNDNLPLLLAVVITFLWSISFFVDIAVKSYDPNPSVHGLMLLAAGYAFRGALPGGHTPDNRKDNKDE